MNGLHMRDLVEIGVDNAKELLIYFYGCILNCQICQNVENEGT